MRHIFFFFFFTVLSITTKLFGQRSFYCLTPFVRNSHSVLPTPLLFLLLSVPVEILHFTFFEQFSVNIRRTPHPRPPPTPFFLLEFLLNVLNSLCVSFVVAICWRYDRKLYSFVLAFSEGCKIAFSRSRNLRCTVSSSNCIHAVLCTRCETAHTLSRSAD